MDMWWLLKKPLMEIVRVCSTAETVQSASLALQSVDNVHGSDGLSLGVLGVSNSISDHVLQKHLKNTTGLFVDETGDTLHTTTASQTTDGGLGNPLDVVTKNLPVALSTSLPETLASFSTSRHVDLFAGCRDSLKNSMVLSKFSTFFYSTSWRFIFLPDLIVKL